MFTNSIVFSQVSFIFTTSNIYKSGIRYSSISILIGFCNSYIQRESFPPNCSSIVPVQKYENPRYPSSVSRRVSFYYFYLQKALSLLKCSSSLPVQISRSPAFSSSVSLLVSFCFVFPQRALFILNYRSCLPIQISKSSESFFVSFCCFYSGKSVVST